MKLSRILSVLFLGLVFTSCADKTILSVEGGKISGVLNEKGDVMMYKGIPYAAPPVGDLRWVKPQPVLPWEGIRACNDYGLASWQVWNSLESFTGKEFYYKGPQPMGEDCLTLNVWTPKWAAGNAKAKLPVAMYIHGGGFTIGLSNHCALDGEYWAQQDVVTVIINYRLGNLGFFCHPLLSQEDQDGVSGNYGLYDQLAALDWICNNIESFGGDPNNITVFGQSAGAMSVKDLIISPLAKGKIAKAIMQSGGGVGGPGNSGVSVQNDIIGQEMMEFGGYTTLEQMRALTPEQLNDLANRFAAETGKKAVTSPYVDGVIMTEDMEQAIEDGSILDIPYIIGATADDLPFGKGVVLDEFCNLINEHNTQPIYQYSFDRKLPGDDSGAFHGSDLWYTFHTVGRNWRPWTEEDYALSEQMIKYWTNFVKFGDPNGPENSETTWPAYTIPNPFKMIFDVK